MQLGSAARSVAVVCSSLGALASAAGCSGARNGGAHEAWSYQRQRGVTAVLRPADAVLYRALLPEEFEVPQDLRLLVAVVSYDEVTAPLVPYREGYVMLACTHQGRAGWYTLTMPVTDRIAHDAGRAIGFPKYVADSIELTDGGGGAWTGEVGHQGRSVMRVAFTPQTAGAPVASTGGPGAPAFNRVPPGEGTEVYEVSVTFHEEQRLLTVSGTVSITSEVDEPWVGLLAQASLVSAQFAEATGDWNLVASKL